MKIDRIVETTQQPDSVLSRHILIAYQGAQRATGTLPKEDAKALADSIFDVVKRNKSKFETLAAEFSSDASNKDKGGELNYITPQSRFGFAPEFANFVYENEKGALDLVETSFGFHIIEVLEQKNLQKVMKLATVAKEIIPSNKTLGEVYNTTQKFEIAASKGEFDKVAEENGYTPSPVNNIRAMDENLSTAGNQRSIVQWAFNEDSKVGDVKRFQVNNGYLVVQLTKRAKEGLKDATTASPQVTPILRNQKKAARIKETIKSSDLSAIAADNSQSVQTAGALNMATPTIAGVAGQEPKVIGAAFSLKEGETSGPIEGERGVFVVRVTKISEATTLDNYAAYANQETQKSRTGVTSKVIAALKEAADIDDNRSTFY